MPFRIATLLALLLLSLACLAQTGIDNDFVTKQFGSTCAVLGGPQPLTGDLDGDGVEDIVIPGRCTNPLLDEAEKDFRVVDPYNSYFGYGNPKITTGFASEDPERRGVVLLVIHGQGPEAWRAAAPKAKFVIINLPFKQVMLKKLNLRRKSVTAIYSEEAGGDQMTSALYWDGKKYKYAPLGSSLE